MDDANNASDDEEHDEQTRALRLIQPSTATPPRPTQPRPSTATPTAPTTTPPTSRAAAATPTFVHSYSTNLVRYTDDKFFWSATWPKAFKNSCVFNGKPDCGSGLNRAGQRAEEITVTELFGYLTNHISGRYSSDPSLTFSMQHIKHAQQCLSSTKFGLQNGKALAQTRYR